MEKTFINPNQNDNFVFLRGLDLQELLVQVENFYLEYRDQLNLPDDVTFGVEIEYEGIARHSTDRFVEENLSSWNSKDDGSLNSGGEITSPVMTDKDKYWKELKIICEYLTQNNADTLHNAGGHIHIGANVLDDDIEAWKSFLKLYIAYENVLFRFVYGDKISARSELFRYAPPRAEELYKNLSKINFARDMLDIESIARIGSRYTALNLRNVDFLNRQSTHTYAKNTIEFRSPNATTNSIVWQNNINALSKMLVTSREKVMDEEFLDYKLKHEFIPYSDSKYLYNNVSLKNVLEFVDLVFDNNLDKVYFLRQYLKDFQENYGMKMAVESKKFVK